MSSISLGDIQNLPTRSKFAVFRGFLNFFVHQNFVPWGGGGGMCTLFQTYGKTPCWEALVGKSSYPKAALQKQRPPKRIESCVRCGRRQVAARHMHKGFLLWWWMYAGKNAPIVCPHSVLAVCSFPHQRFSRCMWASISTLREFVCGHCGCLLTTKGSKQHGHRPKPMKI